MKKHLIIDGHNLLYRAHYVSNLTDSKGRRTSGIFGTMNMLPPLLTRFRDTTNVIITWDHGRCKNRLKLYPQYKKQRDKNRKPEDVEAMNYQRIICQKIFSYLPVKQVFLENIEGDDIIGYLSEKLKGKKVIVSNDQDFFQLVNNETSLYIPNKTLVVSPANVTKVLGFSVEHYVLWKSMVGDKSDNIKGIHGIGPKKATAIIVNGQRGGKRLPINEEEMKILQLNKDLIAIGALLQKEDVKKIRGMYIKERAKKTDFAKVRQIFGEHDFNSLHSQFSQWRYLFDMLVKRSKK